MVDKKILAQLKAMRESEGGKPEDALILYEFIKQVAKENEELKEELDDIEPLKVQFVVSDADFKYYVTLGGGDFDYAAGEIDEPNVTMSATQATWKGLSIGELDSTSAYMSGDLKIEGNLQDAIAYGEILSLAMESFEDYSED